MNKKESGRPLIAKKGVISTKMFNTELSGAFFTFLDASTHLYKRVCPSVRPSNDPSIGPSDRNAFVSNTQKRVISTSKVKGTSRGGKRRKEGEGGGRWVTRQGSSDEGGRGRG